MTREAVLSNRVTMRPRRLRTRYWQAHNADRVICLFYDSQVFKQLLQQTYFIASYRQTPNEVCHTLSEDWPHRTRLVYVRGWPPRLASEGGLRDKK